MNKKSVIFIAIILVLLLSFYLLINGQINRPPDIISDLLRTFYTAANDTWLNKATDAKEWENAFESLYQEKYKEYLTIEAYERLAANRILFEPEQAVKDFGCTIEFIKVNIKKSASTIEGNPIYSYDAQLKITLKDKVIKEFTQTGTIELFKEKDQWRVNHFNVQKGSLYIKIKELASGT